VLVFTVSIIAYAAAVRAASPGTMILPAAEIAAVIEFGFVRRLGPKKTCSPPARAALFQQQWRTLFPGLPPRSFATNGAPLEHGSGQFLPVM